MSASKPPCRSGADHAWVEHIGTADSDWNVVIGDRRWQCELCGARQVTKSSKWMQQEAQMKKGDRINRMMAWLENKIDKALEQPDEGDAAKVVREMSVLADLYQLQQTSVRMARQQTSTLSPTEE